MRPWPERPAVTDPKARWWLDWVQTAAYTFWVVLLAVAAVVALVKGVNIYDLTHLEKLFNTGH
jgi:predicted branched-subunit amino acid permease